MSKKISFPGYYLKKDSIRIKSVVPVPRDVAEMHAVAMAYQQQADQTRQSTATGRRLARARAASLAGVKGAVWRGDS